MNTRTLAICPRDSEAPPHSAQRSIVYGSPAPDGSFGTDQDPVPVRREGDPLTHWLVRIVQPGWPTPHAEDWVLRCGAWDAAGLGPNKAFRLQTPALDLGPRAFRDLMALCGVPMNLGEAAHHQLSLGAQMGMLSRRFAGKSEIALHSLGARVAFDGSAGFYHADHPDPVPALRLGGHSFEGRPFDPPVLPVPAQFPRPPSVRSTVPVLRLIPRGR
jgi:hypothetical protein